MKIFVSYHRIIIFHIIMLKLLNFIQKAKTIIEGFRIDRTVHLLIKCFVNNTKKIQSYLK